MKKQLSCAIAISLLLGLTAHADDGESAGRGALFGGLTGATIGGIAGGGKGAAIGLGVGAVGGAMFGAAAGRHGGRDPYKELDRLQRRLARTKNPAKQAELQQRIMDLQNRLGMPAGQQMPAGQMQRGYQGRPMGGYRQPMGGYQGQQMQGQPMQQPGYQTGY